MSPESKPQSQPEFDMNAAVQALFAPDALAAMEQNPSVKEALAQGVRACMEVDRLQQLLVKP